MSASLTSLQRRKLKALAQRLEAIVKVGKHGLSDPLLASVRSALASRELIKVKFEDFKDQKKELARQLAQQTDSHLITLVGHVAVLYRQHPDPDKRRISP